MLLSSTVAESLEQISLSEEDNVNDRWEKCKVAINNVADEVLGMQVIQERGRGTMHNVKR
jgi:hypothetical protein